MIGRSRRTFRRAEEENPYWISFTDLMAGVLLLFILVTAAFMMQLMMKQNELTQTQEAAEAQISALSTQAASLAVAEGVRSEVITELGARLQERGVAVRISPDGSVLSIPTESLGFASGEYAISSAHAPNAVDIGRELGAILREKDTVDYLDTVFIEGHTDGQPFSGALGMGNWGLSTFRAISLWELWEQRIPAQEKLSTLTNGEGKPLFSVSGYGDTRPASGKKSTADNPEDRRIDIRITIVRPSSDDLNAILDKQGAEAVE